MRFTGHSGRVASDDACNDFAGKSCWTWILCGFLLFRTANSVSATEPCLVVVDSGRRLASYRDYRVKAVLDYECSGLLGERFVRSISREPVYRINNPTGFSSVTGVASVLGLDSKLRSVRFWTVSGPEVYAEFIQGLVEVRGAGAVVTGSKHRTQISVSGSSPTADGKGTVTWDPISTCYDQGMILLGPQSAVDAADVPSLHRIAGQAAGKHWFLYADPKAIPERLRAQFLVDVGQAAGIGMQRRDAEGSGDFDIRKAGLEAQLAIAHEVLSETEEFIAWTKWPESEGESFCGRIELHTKKDTQLARWFSSIGGNASKLRLDAIPRGAMIACINVAPNDELRSIVKYHLESQDWKEISLIRWVMAHMNPEKFRAAVAVVSDDDGFPRFVGCVELDESDQFANRMLPITSAIPVDSEDRILVTADAGSLAASIGVARVGLEIRDRALYFTGSRDGSGFDWEDFGARREEESGITREIFKFQVDLSRWADLPPDATSTELLHSLEAAYDHWEYSRNGVTPDSRRPDNKLKARFPSFVPKITADGDWSADVNVRTSNTSVVVNCRVGYDLHKLATARQLVASNLWRNAVMNPGP